jgi:hypothetical protein
LAEGLGCDYGPTLGFLVALGLGHYASLTADSHDRALAMHQYLFSSKQASFVDQRMPMPLGFEVELPF